MKIEVVLSSVLRDAVGKEKLGLELAEASTVRQAIERLRAEYPAVERELFDADGELEPHIFVALNGAQVSREGSLNRALQEGDQLALMISFAGG
ncbi:MAG: ubiquitin-like small modifier protein 1 [Nitrospinota bacterium]